MMLTKFLNVDLDLRAEYGLKGLIEALGSTVIVLNHEENFASLEVASDKQLHSIDETILAFYDLICALPPKVLAIWDQCEMRSMNIGIQAGTTPYSESFYLSSKSISILSAINVDVVITVYAAEG